MIITNTVIVANAVGTWFTASALAPLPRFTIHVNLSSENLADKNRVHQATILVGRKEACSLTSLVENCGVVNM